MLCAIAKKKKKNQKKLFVLLQYYRFGRFAWSRERLIFLIRIYFFRLIFHFFLSVFQSFDDKRVLRYAFGFAATWGGGCPLLVVRRWWWPTDDDDLPCLSVCGGGSHAGRVFFFFISCVFACKLRKYTRVVCAMTDGRLCVLCNT